MVGFNFVKVYPPLSIFVEERIRLRRFGVFEIVSKPFLTWSWQLSVLLALLQIQVEILTYCKTIAQWYHVSRSDVVRPHFGTCTCVNSSSSFQLPISVGGLWDSDIPPWIIPWPSDVVPLQDSFLEDVIGPSFMKNSLCTCDYRGLLSRLRSPNSSRMVH